MAAEGRISFQVTGLIGDADDVLRPATTADRCARPPVPALRLLAPLLAGIDLAVPRLPNIGEMAGQSLLDGLGARNAALSALASVRPQTL